MPPTTTADSTQLGDQVLDAVRVVLNGGPDRGLTKALDDFTKALDDPNADDLKALIAAVEGAVSYYRQWHARGNGANASVMALTRLHLIAAAVDRLAVPFARTAELRAAEAAVAKAERDGAQALADLEQAVADHNVPAVVELRAEVEVGHPGRLAAARMALLRLQIEQASVQTRPGIARAAAAGAALDEAKAARDTAAQALRDAEDNLRTRSAERSFAQQAVNELEAGRHRLTAELAELEANHARDTDARFRRLAGLADREPVPAS